MGWTTAEGVDEAREGGARGWTLISPLGVLYKCMLMFILKWFGNSCPERGSPPLEQYPHTTLEIVSHTTPQTVSPHGDTIPTLTMTHLASGEWLDPEQLLSSISVAGYSFGALRRWIRMMSWIPTDVSLYLVRGQAVTYVEEAYL